MNNQMNDPGTANKKGGLKGFSDAVAKFFPVIAIVFLGIGALGLCYNWLAGLINAIEYGSLRALISGFAGGISCLAKYAFCSVVTIGLDKLIRK